MILAPTLSLSAGSGAAIVRPTFSRDFAGEKTLNNGTGPAITFTRASDATYFDANGTLQTAGSNVPRFDHDPADGNKSRGLLIEEARTNLLERSAEFDDAYWSKQSATVTPNAITAPDGTLTADKVEATSTTGVQVSTDTVVNATSATFTVFLKKGTGATAANVVQLRNATINSNIATISINLDTGAITTLTGVGTSTATSVGNGWWRVSISGTLTSGNTLKCSVLSNFVEFHTAGDFVYAWGAQLEEGAFATSYIPTTSAAATRAADSAVVTPISSFYNQDEGTLFAEGVPRSLTTQGSVSRQFLNFNSGGGAHQNYLGQNGTNDSLVYVYYLLAGGSPAGMSVGSSILSGAQKIIGAYRANDFAAVANGGSPTTQSSGSVSSAITHLNIGFGATANTGLLSGHIRKIAYWPKRLTNTLLQQLTT